MCGIVGILKHQDKISKDELLAFTHSLHHRGPDSSGIYINNEGYIGIGHCRLSIFDISSKAHQPMKFNNKYWITYNGEIYNFLEMREELIKYGYSFNSNSDTEVILAAYDKWGIKCQEKFNGMWAFAIWDNEKKYLFLSRDRFGIKPLYFINNAAFFAFASETSAFSKLHCFNKEIDLVNISNVLNDVYSLTYKGATIYKEIDELLPGSYLILSKNTGLKKYKWWRTEENLIDVPDTYEEQVEHFKELFFDACKIRMRSDVPIAFTLSGGLDSSSVYSTCNLNKHNHYLKRTTKEGMEAYVAVFPDTEINELNSAQRVVDFHNGKINCVLYHDDHKLVDEIITQTKKSDFIYLTPPIGNYIYRQMKKDNRKISLDGHGADEMLFGYENLIMELHNDLVLSNQKKLKKNILDIYNLQIQKHFNNKLRFYFSQKKINKIINYYKSCIFGKLNLFLFKRNGNNQQKWIRNDYQNDISEVADNLRFLNSDLRASYKYFHNYFLPVLLRNYDSWSMASGVEVRTPFLDWRLVSYIFSLPIESKIGNGYTKRILRDAMKDIIPDKIRKQKLKIGLNAPMEKWFSHQLKNFILDEVNSQKFLNSNIWDGYVIRNFVEDKMKNSSWNQSVDCFKFWPVLNAHILINHN